MNELKFCEVSQTSNRCWKFQLSILKNKKVLFLKKIDLSCMARIVLFSTNRCPLDGAILVWRFWARHIVIVRHVVGKENNHTSGIKMPILRLWYARHSVSTSSRTIFDSTYQRTALRAAATGGAGVVRGGIIGAIYVKVTSYTTNT